MEDAAPKPKSPTTARCLLVDDEPALLRALKRVIQAAHPEWQLVCARDGEEALKQLAESHFDAVILDLHMPRVDGVALMRQMIHLYPSTSRIVHSSHVESLGSDLSSGLADDVVRKPAQPKRIVAALEFATRSDCSTESPAARLVDLSKLPAAS